jgi:mono/diheme cytochrome c family protein
VNLLDNQLTKSETLIPWIASSAFAILLAVCLALFGLKMAEASDPYVKSVLSITGNPIQGQAIFQTNCAGCHGLSADGFVGPSLQAVSQRKSPYRLIRQVISGETPPMPKFQPSIPEMADLLSYLETL